VDVLFQVTDSSSPQQTNDAVLSLTIEPAALLTAPGGIYNYTASYDGVGNVVSYTDSVMGTWNMTVPGGGSGYDSLNRLIGANATWPDGTPQSFCWQYDAFGNRTKQSALTGDCTSSLATTTSYTPNNQIAGGLVRYDLTGVGNIIDDANTGNSYLYDAEGRLCAVNNEPVPGTHSMTGYLYDADGARVAKGTITSMSCDATSNGFQFTENYVLGPSGEQLTQLDGNNNWQRTNVYIGGKLLATYDVNGLHFQLTDPLGTRRKQTSGNLATLGVPETDIQSLPFGDQLNSYPDQYATATADDATPLHYTGKERDTESGNDYFGARYYASSMGRFLSPDWSAKVTPVPYAKLDNPQSLNLYAYVGNNPMTRFDPDGHWVCNGNKEQCAQIQTGLDLAKAAVKNLGADSTDGKAIQKVIDLYGPLSEKSGDKGDNGVNVSFASLQKGELGKAALGGDGHTVNITFDLGQINASGSHSSLGGTSAFGERAGVAIHEGTHGVDERAWGHNPYSGKQEDWTEHNAYRNQSNTFRGLGWTSADGLWYPGMTARDQNAAIDAGAQRSDAAAGTE
jgi:RHS repeat-associated protein